MQTTILPIHWSCYLLWKSSRVTKVQNVFQTKSFLLSDACMLLSTTFWVGSNISERCILDSNMYNPDSSEHVLRGLGPLGPFKMSSPATGWIVLQHIKLLWLEIGNLAVRSLSYLTCADGDFCSSLLLYPVMYFRVGKLEGASWPAIADSGLKAWEISGPGAKESGKVCTSICKIKIGLHNFQNYLKDHLYINFRCLPEWMQSHS